MKSYTFIARDNFDVELYRQLILKRLEELSVEFNNTDSQTVKFGLNLERLSLAYALELTYDGRMNKGVGETR